MTEREALKLALEALDYAGYLTEPESDLGCNCLICQATAAVKEALAQPEQELLAWKNAALRVGEDLSSIGPNGYYNMTAQQWLDWAMAQQPRGNNSLAQPEQEPFGHVTVRRLSQRLENHHDQYQFYPAGQSPYLDNVDECHTVYTNPYVATPLPTQPDLGAICQDLQEMTYNQAMRIAELEDKLKMALEALEEFGEHYNWCHQFPTYAFPENYPPCNCGYDEAITVIKNVLKMKEQP